MILKSFRVSFQLLLLHSYRWNLCNWSTFSDYCGKIARHRSFIGAAITVAQQIKSPWRQKVQQMSALFDVQQKQWGQIVLKVFVIRRSEYWSLLSKPDWREEEPVFLRRPVCTTVQLCLEGGTSPGSYLARSAAGQIRYYVLLSAHTEAWRGVGL